MDIGAPENRPQLASGYKPLSQLSEARQQLTSLANVSKAQRSAENRVVKKFSLVGNDKLSQAKQCLREIRLFRCLEEHYNITRLYDIDIDFHRNGDFDEVHLTEETYSQNIGDLIRTEGPLSDSWIASFIHQILSGLGFIHSAGIVHPDLRSETVFVDANHEIKIGGITNQPPSSNANIALDNVDAVINPYEPPEMTLGYGCLTAAANMWSMGCILAELIGGVPIFDETSIKTHVYQVFEVAGIPAMDTISRMPNAQIQEYIRSLGIVPLIPFETRYLDAHPDALDLLSQMLVLNPDARITSEQPLRHDYLKKSRYFKSNLPFHSFLPLQEEGRPTIFETKTMIVEEVHSLYAQRHDNFVRYRLVYVPGLLEDTSWGSVCDRARRVGNCTYDPSFLDLPASMSPRLSTIVRPLSAIAQPCQWRRIFKARPNTTASHGAASFAPYRLAVYNTVDAAMPEDGCTTLGYDDIESSRISMGNASSRTPMLWSRLKGTVRRLFKKHLYVWAERSKRNADLPSYHDGGLSHAYAPRLDSLPVPSITMQIPGFELRFDEDFGHSPPGGSPTGLTRIAVKANMFSSSPTSTPNATTDSTVDGVLDLTSKVSKQSDHPIAGGGFGDIWKCLLLKGPGEDPEPVAVKAIRTYLTADEGEENKRYRREFRIWKKLDHANILPLYGATRGFGLYPAMVCPWAEHGTLEDYVKAKQWSLSMKDKFQLLDNTATGLVYLHERDITHGDLTGRNVLVRAGSVACLADFGMSTARKELYGSAYFTESAIGTLRWAAPELFVPDENDILASPNPKCDVYSFGGIMLLVLTGRVPYHYLRDTQLLSIVGWVIKSKRPTTLDTQLEDQHWEIIEQCWSGLDTRGESRPPMSVIARLVRDELHRYQVLRGRPHARSVEGPAYAS